MINKDMKNRLYIIIGSIVIFIFAGFVGFNFFNLIKETSYEERKESLLQLIETSGHLFNETAKAKWDTCDLFCNNTINYLDDFDDVSNYLKQVNKIKIDENDLYYLVDSEGRYYCDDENIGKIIDTEYYLSKSEDKLEYLGSLPHLATDSDYLIFRTRLAKPIITTHNNEQIQIVYCALMSNVIDINEDVINLFSKQSNVFIFDTDTGVMLYKNFGIKLIIDGYNVYPKFAVYELAYDDKPEAIVEQVKNGETIATQMKTPEQDYFICSTKIAISNWSLMIVTKDDYLNVSNDNSSVGIIVYIIINVVLLGAAISALMIWSVINKANHLKRIEEEKASNALKQAYKIKSDFLANMSHDIRTPINGIIGMATIGSKIAGNSDKTNDCFNKINVSSKHLLSLVNDVLDMSEIESNKTQFTPAKMDLKSMLDECLDIIKGQLVNRKLILNEDINVNHQYVIGDELHLKRVLINILNNAVKFTKDGGSITLSVKQLENINDDIQYEFCISDTGIGMSKEFIKKIFEPFTQENTTARTKYVGSGLGTAICKEYVEMMNGSIKVESEVNVGSTFTFTIPFKQIEINNQIGNIENLNILLVEDNVLNVEITKEYLKEKNITLTCAYNGKQALEIFAASKINEFDLILMDVMMPEMNGLEATRHIRQLERVDNNIPIIALTANTFKDDIKKILAAGMNAYLSKPFNTEKLFQVIHEVKTNEKQN